MFFGLKPDFSGSKSWLLAPKHAPWKRAASIEKRPFGRLFPIELEKNRQFFGVFRSNPVFFTGVVFDVESQLFDSTFWHLTPKTCRIRRKKINRSEIVAGLPFLSRGFASWVGSREKDNNGHGVCDEGTCAATSNEMDSKGASSSRYHGYSE